MVIDALTMFLNLTKYFSLLMAYSIIISTFYLLGYWGSFDINIFEYIEISDILKMSIYHLIIFSTPFILSFLLIEILIIPLNASIRFAGSETSKLAELEFLWKYRRLIALVWLLGGLYPILSMTEPIRWILSAILLFPIITIIAQNIETDFLVDVIQNQRLRTNVLLALTWIFLFSYPWGTLSAIDKRNADSTIEINDTHRDITYLGKTGSHVFFWDKNDKKIEIVRESAIVTLKITLQSQSKSFFDILADFHSFNDKKDVAETNSIKEQ
ncbi:hypothetical protein C8R34_10588 [Nitrosomonas sp. Nm84]|uniref:hypothetical protein n=1 Tax=Nitrosomonas sp. Nm84 TaxID=200124 RepID=UPI000D75A281|nr:hypothetical protein [Nitrosomonas sp. Nm84]PXW89108.1 hypothetical protein C8R34_10588 [Nitrosomonas sp. Nm84]